MDDLRYRSPARKPTIYENDFWGGENLTNHSDKDSPGPPGDNLVANMSNSESHRPKLLLKISSCLPIVIILIIYTASILQAVTSSQQNSLCPKVCICDEQSLEIRCKEPIGASGLPHTLNYNTKRMIINNAQTTQLSGIDYLFKLELLDLANNKITSIDFEQISKNTNLLHVNTSRNSIMELKDTAISNVLAESAYFPNDQSDFSLLKSLDKINIVDLSLSYNNIRTLRNFTFARLHKLRRLDLSFNTISYLEPSSLFGLNKLEFLSLRSNRLTQVPTQAIHSSVKSLTSSSTEATSLIKTLDLGENIFTHIDSNSFSLLREANELYLDSCSIESIHERAFNGLYILYLLSLDNNNLDEVPTASFSYVSSLISLRMSSNNFSKIHADSFVNLDQLEELFLNNGTFSALQKGTFNSLSKLRRLEISHNPNLIKIHPGTFRDLPKLVHLSLYSNSLTSLPDEFSDRSQQLYFLDLRANPLSCNCDLKWLTKFLRLINETATLAQQTTNNNPSHNQDDEGLALLKDHLLANELVNLTCFSPPALAGKSITDLPDNKLDCLNPGSDLNVHVGYLMLTFIMIAMILVCSINLCHSRSDGLLVMLKNNIAQSSMVIPYSCPQNVDKMKNETQLYGMDFDIQHGSNNLPAQIYSIPDQSSPVYCEPHPYY